MQLILRFNLATSCADRGRRAASIDLVIADTDDPKELFVRSIQRGWEPGREVAGHGRWELKEANTKGKVTVWDTGARAGGVDPERPYRRLQRGLEPGRETTGYGDLG